MKKLLIVYIYEDAEPCTQGRQSRHSLPYNRLAALRRRVRPALPTRQDTPFFAFPDCKFPCCKNTTKNPSKPYIFHLFNYHFYIFNTYHIPKPPNPMGTPVVANCNSTLFTTSTCPPACRDARSERPGNFVYNQSETDFLICRTLRPSVPTESGALCRTHAKTKHGLSQNKTWPFTTRNATFHKTKCGKRRCRLPHSTLWFAKIKPINGFRSVYGS